jgi:hypothetical protein
VEVAAVISAAAEAISVVPVTSEAEAIPVMEAVVAVTPAVATAAAVTTTKKLSFLHAE